ncbi:MAG TPA: Ig domain-containing protein [Flavipsychrobacter sp.]|nr:Ig domain-containing protein [Flavipsychrobacter sp.]
MTARGGVAPYRWTISAGSLPAGLSIGTGNGIISGVTTATVSTTYTFTIRATDKVSATGSRSYTVTVAPVTTLNTNQLISMWTRSVPDACGLTGTFYSLWNKSTDGTPGTVSSVNAGTNLSITAGSATVNPTLSTIPNPTFTTSVTTPIIKRSDGSTAFEADNAAAMDITGAVSASFGNRKLYKNDGSTISIDWQDMEVEGDWNIWKSTGNLGFSYPTNYLGLNDPSTGEAQKLGFATKGTIHATIDTVGRFAIGRSNPTAWLHVDKATDGDPLAIFESAQEGGMSLMLKSSYTGGINWRIYSQSNGNPNPGGLGFYNGSQFMMQVSNYGISVGQNAPTLTSRYFAVASGTGTANWVIRLQNSAETQDMFSVRDDGLIDEMTTSTGSASFTTTAATDTVLITGGEATDLYWLQQTGTGGLVAEDLLRVEAISGGFVAHRTGGGGSASGLTYNWIRRKQ